VYVLTAVRWRGHVVCMSCILSAHTPPTWRDGGKYKKKRLAVQAPAPRHAVVSTEEFASTRRRRPRPAKGRGGTPTAPPGKGPDRRWPLWIRGVTTMAVCWASGEASSLVGPPLNLVICKSKEKIDNLIKQEKIQFYLSLMSTTLLVTSQVEY
jgi:hypothetical protein